MRQERKWEFNEDLVKLTVITQSKDLVIKMLVNQFNFWKQSI